MSNLPFERYDKNLIKNEDPLSPSVQNLFNNINRNYKTISSLEIIEELCKMHSEYANGKAGKFSFERMKTSKKAIQFISETPSIWKSKINSLYNKERTKIIHGRLIIIGLSLIDKKLAETLIQDEFLSTIINEVEEKPFESLLNEDKLELWKQLSILLFHKEQTLGYFIRNYKDDISKVDLFGRKPLAVVLADIINDLRKDNLEEGSFVINIHGPWGSGKSTLLGYIEDELKKEDVEHKQSPWIIVKFNAWQNQRTNIPLWWSLMDAVFRESTRKLLSFSTIKIKIFEYFWRFRTGHSYIFWILSVVLAFVGIFLYNYNYNNNLNDSIKPEALIVLAGSLISIIGGIRSSLTLGGSSNAAKTFLETNSEPTKKIQNHFEKLIQKINKPVAFFIDDLDRCDKDYVIKFLESIHTLFKRSNLIYIIAADQRWIYSCYEKNYHDFKDNFDVPGRQLGYLFMDKLFQLNVPLPRLSKEDKEKYLKYLLFNKPVEENKNLDQQVNKIIQDHNNDPDALINTVNKGLEDEIVEKKLRDELVKNLQTKKMQEHTEHFLMQFAHFLDPNPRSMKLFMNIFNIVRAVDILSSAKIDQRKLALWTILNVRWPDLTKFLDKQPEMIKYFDKKELDNNDPKIPEHIKPLFNNNNAEILDIINGKKIGVKIDEDTLRGIVFW